MTTYIKSVTRPNGYNGSTITAYLVLDGERLIEVFPFGWCRSPCLPMDFQDVAEAAWHIDNHPAAKRYYS